jgi:glycosyltransferase involved in cell wall biosynthesis
MSYLAKYNIKSFVENLSLNSTESKYSIGSWPKISVVVASYNQDKYLERTILSIINQNYSNTELIIIDGASTDKSVEIIKKYSKYISFWVSEKDNGQADAINKGFNIATGDLLCFQNSDDLFYQNTFKILGEFYMRYPDFDCYFGDLLFIDTDDTVLEVLKTANFDINSQILEGTQIFNQSMFFKKKLGERLGFLDANLRFVIDYENVLRWAKGSAKFIKVQNMLGAFRIHGDSKTSNLEDVRKFEHEKVKNEYFSTYFAKNKPNKLFFKILRLKKLLYFARKLDFSYIMYRFSLKK